MQWLWLAVAVAVAGCGFGCDCGCGWLWPGAADHSLANLLAANKAAAMLKPASLPANRPTGQPASQQASRTASQRARSCASSHATSPADGEPNSLRPHLHVTLALSAGSLARLLRLAFLSGALMVFTGNAVECDRPSPAQCISWVPCRAGVTILQRGAACFTRVFNRAPPRGHHLHRHRAERQRALQAARRRRR